MPSGRKRAVQDVRQRGNCTLVDTERYDPDRCRWERLTRQIAELLAEYNTLIASTSSKPQALTRRVLQERTNNVYGQTSVRPQRRATTYELSITTDFESHVEPNAENEDEQDSDVKSVTSASTTTFNDNSETARRKSQAEIHADQVQARKDKRSAKKMRHSQRNRVGSLITSSDVDHIAAIIHGEFHDDPASSAFHAHPLASDKTIDDVIERNFSLVWQLQAHKLDLCRERSSSRNENKDKKRLKQAAHDETENGEIVVDTNEVVSAIMLKLGVSPVHVKASLLRDGSNDINARNSDTPTNTPLSSSFPPYSPAAAAAAAAQPTHRKHATTTPVSLSHTTSASTSPRSPASASASASASNTPKPILATTVRLRQAIARDLGIHENEVHATAARAAGFWRYVGKVVFQRMAERVSK